jgi:hypothetical protein
MAYQQIKGDVMFKTTIYIDEFLQAQIKRVAQRDHKSQAATMREALMKFVGFDNAPSEKSPVRHRAIVGAFNSGDPDFAHNVREKLRADAKSGAWKP